MRNDNLLSDATDQMERAKDMLDEAADNERQACDALEECHRVDSREWDMHDEAADYIDGFVCDLQEVIDEVADMRAQAEGRA